MFWSSGWLHEVEVIWWFYDDLTDFAVNYKNAFCNHAQFCFFLLVLKHFHSRFCNISPTLDLFLTSPFHIVPLIFLLLYHVYMVLLVWMPHSRYGRAIDINASFLIQSKWDILKVAMYKSNSLDYLTDISKICSRIEIWSDGTA